MDITHIAFVAKETIPVLIAALDQKIRPQRVILLHTPDEAFSQRAHNLARTLEKHQITADLETINDAFHPHAIEEKLVSLIKRYSASQRLIFNLTTGTHIMTTAAIRLAERNNIPAFYIHPDDRLIWLPSGSKGHNLSDCANLEDILTARGFEILEHCASKWRPYQRFIKHLYEHRASLLEDLIHHTDQLKRATAQGQANNAMFQAFSQHIPAELNQLLQQLPDHPQSDLYLKGEWLEHYVTHAAYQFQKQDAKLQDIYGGIKIASNLHGNRWEIDMLLLYNNHLHVIECKTIRPDQDNNTKLLNFIFKLDSLRIDTGGQLTRGMLFSTLNNLPARTRERASHFQIEMAGIQELIHIDQTLKAWLR